MGSANAILLRPGGEKGIQHRQMPALFSTERGEASQRLVDVDQIERFLSHHPGEGCSSLSQHRTNKTDGARPACRVTHDANPLPLLFGRQIRVLTARENDNSMS